LISACARSPWRYSSPVGLGALSSLSNGRVGRHCPVSTARTMPSKKTVRMGTKAKPLALCCRRLCCSEAAFLCHASQSATLNSGAVIERLIRPAWARARFRGCTQQGRRAGRKRHQRRLIKWSPEVASHSASERASSIHLSRKTISERFPAALSSCTMLTKPERLPPPKPTENMTGGAEKRGT
jgi:hypothetical protein